MNHPDLAAPGLTADWLNAWLAAIGVTVLVPEARLGWSTDRRPMAWFWVEGRDLPAKIAEALPSTDDLGRLSIARSLVGHPDLLRAVPLEVYKDRAAVARHEGDFSLEATVTDLQGSLPQGGLPHSPFDTPAPQGRTLHQRLAHCRSALGADLRAEVVASFGGSGRRIAANGLGFDCRRFASGVQPDAPKMVDPVVECLAFFGMALFPARGNGTRPQTRGWQDRASKVGAFRWPAWSAPLDRWAIDALLDRIPSPRERPGPARLLGFTSLFETVPYRPVATADTTRAYGSRRVW